MGWDGGAPLFAWLLAGLLTAMESLGTNEPTFPLSLFSPWLPSRCSEYSASIERPRQ